MTSLSYKSNDPKGLLLNGTKEDTEYSVLRIIEYIVLIEWNCLRYLFCLHTFSPTIY